MPEEALKQEIPSAQGSAGASAEEEWLPTKEASRLAGASARTLKRRGDLGALRRTTVHTQFGVESRYLKEDIIKLKGELRQAAEGLADGIAEVNAEVGGRRADVAEGKSAERAGGDRGSRSLADPAEVSKAFANSLTKLTEPFFKLTNTLERGFDKFLHFQEESVRSQERLQKRLAEDRREMGEKGRKAEWIRSLVWLSFCAVVVGLLATGAYYGYTRVTKYYEEELSLREKEIGVWGNVYDGLLAQHQRELNEKDLKIEDLKKEIENREEISAERGEDERKEKERPGRLSIFR